MSFGAGNLKETSGGYKRKRSDRVAVGVRAPRGKMRKIESSSLLDTPAKHPASVRVLNQPLDPKALKKNPKDDEKRSRVDAVIMVYAVRGPREKRQRIECSHLPNAPEKYPTSGRVFNQPLDSKALKKKPMDETLSLKKASHAARLKSQKQINLVTFDPLKRQQEKGKFKRMAEEKTKIKKDEAAAKKKVKVELKKQREREADRIASRKMGRTAFEHGKILCSRLKVVDGSRKNSREAQPSRNSSSLPKKSKSSKEKVAKVALNARVAENSVTWTSQRSKFDVPHSGERLLTSISNAQMSPKKDSRAATLKSRYANIIMKSQQRLDTVKPVKTQEEYEMMERSLTEDKANIRAAEAAAEKKTKEELEKQRQREREREAARIALQKMEATAGIELNLEIFKELEILSGCSLSRKNPLPKLGLFLKQKYLGGEDDAILYDDIKEVGILP